MYLSMNINVLYDSSLHALYSEVSTTTSNVGQSTSLFSLSNIVNIAIICTYSWIIPIKMSNCKHKYLRCFLRITTKRWSFFCIGCGFVTPVFWQTFFDVLWLSKNLKKTSYAVGAKPSPFYTKNYVINSVSLHIIHYQPRAVEQEHVLCWDVSVLNTYR